MPLANLGQGLQLGKSSAALTASPNVNSTTTAATQAATTTALAASNLTPSYGQNITLTATVSTGSGTVTGLVQFYDGTTVIGTASLRNGVAQLQVGDLAVNATGTSHSLTAQYMGSDSYAASVSPVATNATVTVSQASTVTVLSSSGNPVAAGLPLTLIAQVSPNYSIGPVTAAAFSSRLAGFLGGLFGHGQPGGQSNGLAPTGTVTFNYTYTPTTTTSSTTSTSATTTTVALGTVLLNNGQAELTVPATVLDALQAGGSISAVYSGDADYLTSNSQTILPSVGSTLSSARLSVQASRAVVVNGTATLSISVGPGRSSTATAVPTGSVTFYDATTGLPLASTSSPSTDSATLAGTTNPATATFSTTFATSGLHLIIATYGGDTNYAAQEAIVPVYVQASSTSNGRGGFGGGGFGAPLTGGGSTATVSTSQAATTIALATSDATPSYGQNVTLTATVSTSSGTVTGLVQFSNGSTVVGTASLRNGVATLQIGNLAAGSYSFTAQYMGNASYLASSPSSSVAVTIGQTPTVTLLASAPSPVDPTGQALALVAQVLPNYNTGATGTTTSALRLANLVGGLFGRGGPGGEISNGIGPSGTVTFSYTYTPAPATGSTTTPSPVTTTLGTAVLLNNGRAELVLDEATLAALPSGATIAAAYTPTPGNGNYAASTSQTISPTVSSTLSAARLSVWPSGPVTESSATFSITVGPGRSSTATAIPTGTVSFYDATTGAALANSPVTLPTSTTNPVTASFSTTFTTSGLHLIIATYSGDSNYAGQEVIIPVYVGSGSSSGGNGSAADYYDRGFGFGRGFDYRPDRGGR